MKTIQFVETTLRDGHQSLWATRMKTAHMLPIAPLLDQAGFKSIELMGTVHFDACLRYLREDPWERIRLLHKAMPNTPLSALIRSKSLTSFNIVPDSIIELWVQRCAANGIRRLMIFDALHDWNNLSKSVATAKAAGIEVAVPLVYSLSPVHTDEFYRQKTVEMIELLDPDIVMIKDSIGLLTPERIKTLVPTIKNEIGDRSLEMHSHCTTGLATLCCLDSVKFGVDTIYTCASPLANGPSHPSTENMIMNLKRLGYKTEIDLEAVKQVSEHFRYICKRENRPLGVPVEYDAFQYVHQIPGGMISNLEFMLSQRGMAHRLEEVLNEISVIREEWGYPVMITPFSQIVGTQAVLNVLTGERYKTTTEEGARYVLGHYGQTPAPVDENVLDKITQTTEGRKFLNWVQPQPSIAELRKEFGHTGISDDELLLRILFPAEHIEATLTAGPINTKYPRGDKPVMTLIQELTARNDFSYIEVQKKGFSLSVRK
ncbi:MAG: pyruvate carboxylase subunit B [Deltaproteobacteria bacterium]|jgi:oxaloacetate decarboxylase (Na+ extruding) subunit alpha|nr:pyruvate carboxylase subunit B [Deltaproteobacteria bacterium]MBT7893174.1 pyruvate carboxylase subunit B [Deltaproteobacteria bacterium]